MISASANDQPDSFINFFFIARFTLCQKGFLVTASQSLHFFKIHIVGIGGIIRFFPRPIRQIILLRQAMFPRSHFFQDQRIDILAVMRHIPVIVQIGNDLMGIEERKQPDIFHLCQQAAGQRIDPELPFQNSLAVLAVQVEDQEVALEVVDNQLDL